MGGARISEEAKARLVKVLRDEPDVPAYVIARRFGISKTVCNAIRRELGVKYLPLATCPRNGRVPAR